jgi:DNA-directed RNA polymerase subunit RPC12/RpoP
VTQFRYMRGAVYILENLTAQRVKVGMTINDVELRLRDANAMWLERKITCQICGARRLAKVNLRIPRVVPRHSASGINCPGGNARSLEHDTSLATDHLEYLKREVEQLSGTEKASMVRRINKLEERLFLRSQHQRAVGRWNIGTVYYTDCAEQVELLSHEYLAEHLDRHAPFGEVFSCSISRAREAVEMALNRLGLLDRARCEDSVLAGRAEQSSA